MENDHALGLLQERLEFLKELTKVCQSNFTIFPPLRSKVSKMVEFQELHFGYVCM